MRIAVRINTVAALRAGKDAAGCVAFAITPDAFSPEERDLLARKVTAYNPDSTRWPAADVYLTCGPGPVDLLEPTTEELRRVLGECGDLVAQQEREKEERAAGEAPKREKTVARVLALPPNELVEGDGSPGNDWRPINPLRDPIDDPRLADAAATAAAECARRKAERQKAEAGRWDSLKAWVREHGSELVRLRLEEGYESWIAVAAEEYGEAFVSGVPALAGLESGDPPDGYDCDSFRERTHPTLAELKLLRH